MNNFAVLAFLLGACAQSTSESSASPSAAGTAVEAQPTAKIKTPGEAPTEGTVIATWDGGQLTYGDLYAEVKGDLTRLEVDYLQGRYDAESSGLDQMVITRLLEDETKARGAADTSAMLDAELSKRVTDPTDAEIAEFYEVVKRKLQNQPLEAVRDQVSAELRRRAERDAFGTFIEELKVKRGVKTSLPFPELPRFDVSVDDDPMIGNPDARITIVQFAEFQCPYCGKAREAVDQVMADYEGQVRLVFRDFPLSFHARAVPAAIAANCAGEQGKYWEMFNALMSNQRALEEADLLKYATDAGVADMEKWQTCRLDPAQAAEVQKDFEAGQALGVSGTPAFFINGIGLSGAQPYENFKAIIDRELGA